MSNIARQARREADALPRPCRSGLVHMKGRLAGRDRARAASALRTSLQAFASYKLLRAASFCELQAFECRMRKNEVDRSADSSGLPH